MTRELSQTPAAVAARARRAAAATQTATPVLTPEFQDRIDSLLTHAAECGRLDCGHLGKSDSQAVRRAVILYTAEGSGVTLDLSHENSEVTAVYGLLTASQHARPVFTRRGRNNVAVTPGVTMVMPYAFKIRMTTQRVDVFSAMLRGESATMISRARGRDIETIKSHAGYLRRETRAHDATSALIALVRAGRLSDRAMVVTEPDTDPEAS